jgi:hypothetical protein
LESIIEETNEDMNDAASDDDTCNDDASDFSNDDAFDSDNDSDSNDDSDDDSDDNLDNFISDSTSVVNEEGDSETEEGENEEYNENEEADIAPTKAKDKQGTPPRRIREKRRVFELLMMADAAQIVPNRKMNKDFFLKFIDKVCSPLQVSASLRKCTLKDKDVSDLESMLHTFFGNENGEATLPVRVVEVRHDGGSTVDSSKCAQIRIILNKEEKLTRIVRVKRAEFNKIALEDIYEVGKKQMINANIESSRVRKRLREQRNIAATDAMYEHLLSEAEVDVNDLNDGTIQREKTPWRDIVHRARYECGL